MTGPTPRPTPAPGPVPAPPENPGGRELQDSLRTLQELDPADLDAVIAAAEDTHRHLRSRLGDAGGR